MGAGWIDGNRIRFRLGHPESIRGWEKATSEAFLGIARTLYKFADNSGNLYTAIGTSKKFYVESGGTLTDITPIRDTNTLGADPITTVDLSSTVTITDVAHGATAGDYVIISGATAFNGIAIEALNQEFEILSVPTADTYTVETSDAANASGAGGGAAVQAEYLYYTGTNSTIYGTGWGTGTWGRGTWGSSYVGSAFATDTLRIWSCDNFGEDLVFNPRGGPIFYWDATTPTARGVDIGTLSGATDTPEVAIQALVSQQSRHVIAIGPNTLGTAIQDKMLVRWSDSEDVADWTPTTINSSGDYVLNRGSEIITAVQLRSDILIYTDQAMYLMQYIGGQFVFGFTVIANNIYLAGRNAVVSVGDSAYWFGSAGFYVYDGRVSEIPCPLERWLLEDVDTDNGDKIYACTNTLCHEITWFYQSVDSATDEVDKYVTLNYEEQVWYYGELARTAWIEDTISVYPVAASPDGYLYSHEGVSTDGSTEPASDIGAWIQSGPIELGSGDNFVFVDRIIPDVNFTGSLDSTTPTVDLTLSARNWPGAADFDPETHSISRLTVSPDTFTNKKNVRLRGRTISLRADSGGTGSIWRLGDIRADFRPDGSK